jgi:hypothetical protein
LARVSGTVPTIRGPIDVQEVCDQGGISLALTLPVGVRARVALPAADGSAVTCDGKPCPAQRSGRWLMVDAIDAGPHHLSVR